MRDHEWSQGWYRVHVEQAAALKENSSKYRNHNSKKGERKKHTAVSTMKSTVNKICGKKEEEIKKLFNEGIPKYIATPIFHSGSHRQWTQNSKSWWPLN